MRNPETPDQDSQSFAETWRAQPRRKKVVTIAVMIVFLASYVTGIYFLIDGRIVVWLSFIAFAPFVQLLFHWANRRGWLGG